MRDCGPAHCVLQDRCWEGEVWKQLLDPKVEPFPLFLHCWALIERVTVGFKGKEWWVCRLAPAALGLDFVGEIYP